MHLYLDESGSFATAPLRGSWNCVAAYISPEDEGAAVSTALSSLKQACGVGDSGREVKLARVPEAAYIAFLEALVPLGGVVFAAASDAGMNTLDKLRAHQALQANKIEEHKDKMHSDSVRDELVEFARQISGIAPQLYAQLYCHAYLIHSLINRGIVFFVQRRPDQLGAFRWRIDQKDSCKNIFEDSYLKLLLPLLQSMSLRMPSIHLEGADYSQFKRFEFAEGRAPTYLKEDYGIETGAGPGFNLSMLLTEDFEFMDSNDSEGVQVADLINSGLRRCLRGGFRENQHVSALLGSLMVADFEGRPPLSLIGFEPGTSIPVDEAAELAITAMGKACRPVVSPDWESSSTP